MARFFVAAALAATASAAALQRRGDMSGSCGFQIQSSGGVDATLGQYEDGQNRLNGSYATATYYISNGGITDEAGRPCIVTTTNDATHQFQCDLNSPGSPTLGFAIASNGSISFNGNNQFYACPYIYEYNIYTQWLKGQDKCRPIKLSTNSTCAAESTYSANGATSTGYAASYSAATEYSAPPYPISSASVPAPVYGSSAASVPGYSVEVSTPVASIPSYESSTPVATVYSTPAASVYSTPQASVYSTPQASVYSTPQASVYSTPQASVYSTPQASVPIYESSSPVASVPAYSAQSSAAFGSKPAGTTVTQITIVYTSECETTSTAVTSGTTIYSVGTTQSVVSSVQSVPHVYSSSSVSAPSYSAPTAYGSSIYVPASSRPGQSGNTTCTESTATPTTSTIPSASASSTCAAVGTTDSNGYLCNPAHSYPNGQNCELQNGCYYLITSLSTSSIVKSTTPATSAIVQSTTCTESTVPATSAPSFATSYPVTFNSTSSITSGTALAPSSHATSTTKPIAYGSSSSAITSAPSSTQTATSTTATACQTSLEGSYQTPHLITWVSSSHPDTAYGSEYNATINSDCSTIFNFDIPTSYEGKTCSVIFLFPEQADLETSAWSWNEEGSIEFSQLSSAASEATTYDTCPSKESTLNTIAIAAGNSYVVSSGACQAGETVSIEASSVNDLGLEFFEDWNPSSLGLYITAC